METSKTAPMENSVGDSSVSVCGVYGLKVTDLSIMPAKTASTGFVIGRKAVDIRIKVLGLGQ